MRKNCFSKKKHGHGGVQCVSSYSAKIKRDEWTDGQTDGWTGGIAISPGPTARWEIIT